MKNKIALLLVLIMAISSVALFASCDPPEKFISSLTINGTPLSEFVIVYDEDSLDYNLRAAEYIRDTVIKKHNLELKIIDDDAEKAEHEIVVGETSRAISKSLDEKTEGFEFSVLSTDGSIALEGDYFVIAAAAYYFIETYASELDGNATVPEVASVHKPITKEAKNFIMLIGDGMGLYQTLMFDYVDYTVDYSDGENLFYGYLFPYIGYSRTESLSGITDSAAGGTALACGVKTYNEYIGRDKDLSDVKNLTELAYELGMSACVMSTESKTGATPSTFAAHASDRDSSSELASSLTNAAVKYGTIIDCGYDYYTPNRINWMEASIAKNLEKLSSNEKGFFLMYEEAHIDKHCHNNDLTKTFNALVRFNQAIARFMEFAFYNPDTFVLITADHETGKLAPDESGNLIYSSDYHSTDDVPIFAYGHGAELFNDVNIENIQISHTIASFMGDDNFGDQSVYQRLTK